MKIITFIIIFILNSTFFIHNCNSQTGWFEQQLPLNWNIIKIQFINENTGWISMYQDNYPVYPNKLLKSINGGYNWLIIDSTSRTRTFQFINDTIGFASGYNEISYFFSKTTDGGFNWITTNTFSNPMFPIYFVNTTTGWMGGYNDNTVLYRTTDGGMTFHQQVNKPGGGVSKIQFINQPYNGEYYGYRIDAGSELYRTTNSGWNWVKVLEGNNMDNLFFLNKDSGWTTTSGLGSSTIVKFTSNGGANWITQLDWPVYYGGLIFFADANKGWLGRGSYKIFVTTNGGNIWGTQNIPTYAASQIFAVNQLIAWAKAYTGYQVFLHTTDGGGTVTGTGNENISEIPEETLLIRNYPNPFNSITNVKFQIKNSGVVNIKVFDLSGKEVRTLVNEYKPAGIYQVRFDAEGLPSGIYFCRLSVDNAVHTVKKMVIMK